jgi:hypothetical protein
MRTETWNEETTSVLGVEDNTEIIVLARGLDLTTSNTVQWRGLVNMAMILGPIKGEEFQSHLQALILTKTFQVYLSSFKGILVSYLENWPWQIPPHTHGQTG